MRSLLLCCLLLGWAEGAQAAAPMVRATPPQVRLGEDREVLLRITVPGSSSAVRGVASVGRLEAQLPDSETSIAFRWTPPETRHPQTAMLYFWTERAGSPPDVTPVRLPLYGRTELEIETEPRAQVVVRVDGEEFGPVAADDEGQVKVPITVPPGVESARVLATAQGRRTDRSVALGPPPATEPTVIFSPSPLPVDEGGWMLVVSENWIAPGSVEVDVRGGTAELDSDTEARYRLRPEANATKVVAEVRIGAQRLRGEVQVEAEAKASGRAQGGPIPVALTALAGGFLASGENGGPVLSLGASVPLSAMSPRLAVEVELGFRRAAGDFTTSAGPLQSRVFAFPVDVALRMKLWEHPKFRVYGRAGAGVTFYRHRLESAFQSPWDEGGAKLGAFAAVQGGYPVSRRLLGLVEIRGAYQPVGSERLAAQVGGLVMSVGARYAL